MNMKKLLLVLWVCALACVFVFIGINWGVPSSRRIALMSDEDTAKEGFFDSLSAARKVVYKDTKSPIFSSPFYRNDELKAQDRWVIDYKKDGANLYFANAMRHYFLCSNDPDENTVFIALANFSPSRLDFNPHLYFYGGGYLYPLAAALKAASYTGLLHLVGDLKYYYKNVDEMGRMYIAGRSFGAVMGTLGILMLVLFEFRLSGSVFWSAALAGACFLSPVIVTMSKALKPHYYVIFFAVSCLLLTHRFFLTKERKFLMGAMFLCGWMAGAAVNSAIYALLPALVYLNALGEERPGARRVLKDAALGCSLFAAGLLICNPYWLVTPGEVIAESKYLNEWINYTYSLTPLYYTLRHGIGKYLAVPFVIALCAGVYLRKKAGTFNFILLVFILATAVVLSRLPRWPLNARYATFLLPLYFFYLVEMSRLVKWRRPVLRALFVLLAALGVPEALNQVSYCGNDSAAATSTRTQAGKWINENTGTAGIGHTENIIPWTFPPIKLTQHRITVYQGFDDWYADADKPRYFVYSDVSDYFYKEGVNRLYEYYKLAKEFKNDPDAFKNQCGFYQANIPIYVLEKK